MPNNRYSELAKDKGFPKTSSKQQGNEGNPSKRKGEIEGLQGPMDYGMRYGTADWKMPGGWKEQPRNRTWGIRIADGKAFSAGMGEASGGEMGEIDYLKKR